MKFSTLANLDLLVCLPAAPAHAVSWRSAIFALVVLVVGLVSRLFAEWQRRKTLVSVINYARGGTVIVQERGRGGPAMRIEIGSDPKDQITSRGGR